MSSPRKQIYECIQADPGINFREVARRTGIATGTVRHHLNVLMRGKVIMEKSHGATIRFFENHGLHDASWSRTVVLREEGMKDLFDWVTENPDAPQKDILNAMELHHGWSRSTAQHRLQRLVHAGVLSIRLQGRLKIYQATPATGAKGASTARPFGLLPATVPALNP